MLREFQLRGTESGIPATSFLEKTEKKMVLNGAKLIRARSVFLPEKRYAFFKMVYPPFLKTRNIFLSPSPLSPLPLRASVVNLLFNSNAGTLILAKFWL
jgi:hypothetical protein